MPNFETINEAFKTLNLKESFDTAELHYNYNHGIQNIDDNGKSYHGHAAKNTAEFQEAIKNKDLVYLMPNIDVYKNAAKELADAPTADVNITTTKTGVVAFAGTKDVEWGSDFTYKIRFKSKYISKEYITSVIGGGNSFIANVMFDSYKNTFNTDQFCDVVIFKNDKRQLTTNKSIVSFYPAKLSRIEKLIRDCNVYTDKRNTAETNIKEQILVVQNPCSKDKLDFIVVKPLSITSKNLTRKGGVDNMTIYNSGVFYSPSKNEHVIFKLDDEINKQLKDDDDKTYSKASKLTAVAKDTFKLAATKKIFNTEYTGSDNFRQRYVNDLISVWASDLASAIDFIYKEPSIRYNIYKKYGVKEIDDYYKYQNILRDIKSNITYQWKKTADYGD